MRVAVGDEMTSRMLVPMDDHTSDEMLSRCAIYAISVMKEHSTGWPAVLVIAFS